MMRRLIEREPMAIPILTRRERVWEVVGEVDGDGDCEGVDVMEVVDNGVKEIVVRSVFPDGVETMNPGFKVSVGVEDGVGDVIEIQFGPRGRDEVIGWSDSKDAVLDVWSAELDEILDVEATTELNDPAAEGASSELSDYIRCTLSLRFHSDFTSYIPQQ
jgi:hypothetical protein